MGAGGQCFARSGPRPRRRKPNQPAGALDRSSASYQIAEPARSAKRAFGPERLQLYDCRTTRRPVGMAAFANIWGAAAREVPRKAGED